VIVAISAVAAAVFVWRTQNALPVPGSPVYEQASRAFYKGLASLEVGLLDDAKPSRRNRPRGPTSGWPTCDSASWKLPRNRSVAH
jgi:hypothetical protein